MVSDEISTNSTGAGSSLIGFLIGAILGSGITYFVTKKVIQNKADKEIESVVKEFTNTASKDLASEFPVNEVDRIIFNGETFTKDDHPKEAHPIGEYPKVISQEEFVTDDDYDKETLIYYKKSNALTDQFDRVVEIDDVIGTENLRYFGKEPSANNEMVNGEDPDIMYVRNEDIMTDYEVILEKTKDLPETALADGGE